MPFAKESSHVQMYNDRTDNPKVTFIIHVRVVICTSVRMPTSMIDWLGFKAWVGQGQPGVGVY